MASTKKNTKKKKKTTAKKNYIGTYMISLTIISFLLCVFMYIGQSGAIVIDSVKSAVYSVFGVTGIFLPVTVVGLEIYLGKKRNIKRFWYKTAIAFAMHIIVGALINMHYEYGVGEAFYIGFNELAGGGVCGAALSAVSMKLLKKAASYVILSVLFVVLTSLLTGVEILQKTAVKIKELAYGTKDKYEEIIERRAEEEPKRRVKKSDKTSIFDAANEFAEDLEKPKKKKAEKKLEKKAEQMTEKKAEEVSDEESFSDGIDEFFKEIEISEKKAPKFTAPEPEDKVEEQPEKAVKEEKAESITEAEKKQFNNELDKAIEKPIVEYVFPPLSLLDKGQSAISAHRDEMRKTAEKLIAVLDDFGVKAKLLQVTQGPTVTRYEIQPDTGIKLSKIVGLADDLALNLAVSTVLVAPVPGKVAVGVEIPNKKVSSVSVRDMISSDEFVGAKSKLTVALGKDIGGNVVVGDIGKWPHVLIAGATGSGKSVCINTIITSILYKASPEEVKLIMVDPKFVELEVYNGIPHLLIPVVTDPKKAAGALNWAVTEMMRRYELFKETGVRKLESYNKLMESTGGEKVPQLVIIIDELADLMMVAAKEVEDYICRLAQLARAAGIHLIIATQRPSVDVITGLIKANIPSRIAFAVSSQVDSRTILDKGGAEKLLGMGDMLYYPTGARAETRVQGAFVSDEEIERITEFIKQNMGDVHYSEDLAEQIERCATGENGVTPDTEDDGDDFLPDAIKLAIELGKISTSMVQRRLGVGYSRAGRIIDQMEARGIISGANGSKPRDVLISHADMVFNNENEE